MQATRSGALDVRNCAEGRVWAILPEVTGTSVTTIALEIGFTPQYTRKVLASLQEGGLAVTCTNGAVATWQRAGSLAGVMRHVKNRSEPTGARSRRSLCLRVWRHLHQNGAPKDADAIADALGAAPPEIYTALRTLKANEAIRFLRGKSRRERSSWDAIGTPLQVRIALTKRSASIAQACALQQAISSPPRRPPIMINSVWALGQLGQKT